MNAPAKKPLSAAEAEDLIASAELLEQDRFGPKVYALKDGRILKLFRSKRRLSSNAWLPYVKRFITNAEKFRARGIPSVRCLRWGKAPSLQRDYVLYERLPGECLRHVEAIDGQALGHFFGELHEKGIYFRSCHLGNILLLEEGQFGVIDVANTRFRPWPLSARARRRNFTHLRRLPKDRKRLDSLEDAFAAGYRERTGRRPMWENE